MPTDPNPLADDGYAAADGGTQFYRQHAPYLICVLQVLGSWGFVLIAPDGTHARSEHAPTWTLFDARHEAELAAVALSAA